MSREEMEKIRSEFTRLDLHPTYLEHAPVITSVDAAQTSGFELKQGIKALLFSDDKNSWVIAAVPGNMKADQKKIAEALGWSKKHIRMATPEEVREITGCEIGSVPPFGHKTAIPILVDRGVYDVTESVFNIGLRTDTVKIPTHEMRAVFTAVGAQEGDFVK